VGARDPFVFSRGFADQLNTRIDYLINDSDGLVQSRLSTLENTQTSLDEQRKKVDERYDALLLKYKMQFSTLSSLMSQMTAQGEQLKASMEALMGTNN
jgi:flagellar hook-associated protein 2